MKENIVISLEILDKMINKFWIWKLPNHKENICNLLSPHNY